MTLGKQCEAYVVGRFYAIKTDLLHCKNDDLSTIQSVLIYYRVVRHKCFICKTVLINDFHLLDDCGLSRLF